MSTKYTKDELADKPLKGEGNLYEIAGNFGIDFNGINKEPLIDMIVEKSNALDDAETSNAGDKNTGASTAQAIEDDELITVRSTQKKANKNGSFDVVLFERDERHPDEQAWIADNEPHRVFPTNEVLKKIREEKLETVK